jgi:hypothetical protein
MVGVSFARRRRQSGLMTEFKEAAVHPADPGTAAGITNRSRSAKRAWVHVLRHFGEMLLAMGAGMLLLGPAWQAAYTALGIADVFTRPDVGALVMATNMTAGMSVWMRYRRHSWPAVGEMGAAMYVPFLILFVPFWAGALSGNALTIAGHLLMLPAMAVAMRRRRGEYLPHHNARTTA